MLTELKDLTVSTGSTYEEFFNRLGNSGYDVNKVRTSYARAYETNDNFEIRPLQLNYHSPVKKYKFSYPPVFNGNFSSYLNFPFGENLFAVIESSKKLQDDFGDLFGQYGLKLLLSKTSRKLAIAKIEGNTFTEFPYSLIADTLLRYIFHTTAIRSNHDSIILLEEQKTIPFHHILNP